MTETILGILLAVMSGLTVWLLMRPNRARGEQLSTRRKRQLIVDEMAMMRRWTEGALTAHDPLSRGRWLAYAVNARMRVARMVCFGYGEYTRFPSNDVDVAVLIGKAYALSTDLGDWFWDFQQTLDSLEVNDRGNWAYWIPTERLKRSGATNVVYLDTKTDLIH